MAIIDLNKPYVGLSSDDYVASSSAILDSKNIDGIRTGYAWTLGPKSNKQVITTVPMFTAVSVSDIPIFIGHNGTQSEVYNNTSADNTPEITITSVQTAYCLIEVSIFYNSDLYVMGRNSSGSLQVHRCTSNDVSNTGAWNYDLLATDYESGTVPVFYIQGSFLYIGVGNKIIKVSVTPGTGALVQEIFSDSIGNITGITRHGTQFFVYQLNTATGGKVGIWNGGGADLPNSNFSAITELGFQPTKVTTKDGIDYVTSLDGEMYSSSGGYQYIKIIKSSKTRRGNDNTQYINKLDFSYNTKTPTAGEEVVVTAMTQANSDLYIIGLDGLVKMGALIPGIQPSFHKIVNTNHLGQDFTFNNSVYYAEDDKKIYITYKANGVYGVDYIDLASLETNATGYIITTVMQGIPNSKNHFTLCNLLNSFTYSTNSIVLYKRINNGVWETVRTITNTNDIIDLEEINTISDEWFDVQFKIELNNTNQDNTPPLLHSFSLDFNNTK